uniref:Uncharacterized protein n=1 Tax=Acrobeloides nanus TaxID=290746 RepID=A0A914DRL2_9BILA
MCSLREGAIALWQPDLRQTYRYVQMANWTGQLLYPVWIADSIQFAMSFETPRSEKDCSHNFMLADQGFAVKLTEDTTEVGERM